MLAPGGRALFDRMGVPPHNRSRMSEVKPKVSVEQELKQLERRLDELLGTISQLHEENRALRQRQDSMMAERATLLQKNEQVRARVEAMIGRLKAMEHSA
jgi:cell division protein ZapB